MCCQRYPAIFPSMWSITCPCSCCGLKSTISVLDTLPPMRVLAAWACNFKR